MKTALTIISLAVITLVLALLAEAGHAPFSEMHRLERQQQKRLGAASVKLRGKILLPAEYTALKTALIAEVRVKKGFRDYEQAQDWIALLNQECQNAAIRPDNYPQPIRDNLLLMLNEELARCGL